MKDLVLFELAKKLKKKGFREECLLHYTNLGCIFSNSIDTYDRPNQELDYRDFKSCFNVGNSVGLIDAPTISQVLKWLREEKSISIEPYATPYNCWYYMIKYNGQIKVAYLEYKCKTYEEAALDGIEYVLDDLI